MSSFKQHAIRSLLRALPESLALKLGARHRRLARNLPPGLRFHREDYLGDFAVDLDTTFPVEAEMCCGIYEPETVAVIRAHVPVGGVCIDAGANIGALTLALAQQVGKSGRVLCFEPGPPNFAKLERNILGNRDRLGQVDLYPLGLSNRPGEWLWEESDVNRGNAKLSQTVGQETVRVVTLDGHLVFLNHGPDPIERLDFIKSDVEGMELELLKGARDTLRHYRPKILFETMRGWIEEKGETYYLDLETYLQELGYRLCRPAPVPDAELETVSILEAGDSTLAVPV